MQRMRWLFSLYKVTSSAYQMSYSPSPLYGILTFLSRIAYVWWAGEEPLASLENLASLHRRKYPSLARVFSSGGPGRIRTYEAEWQQIYSLLSLTT